MPTLRSNAAQRSKSTYHFQWPNVPIMSRSSDARDYCLAQDAPEPSTNLISCFYDRFNRTPNKSPSPRGIQTSSARAADMFRRGDTVSYNDGSAVTRIGVIVTLYHVYDPDDSPDSDSDVLGMKAHIHDFITQDDMKNVLRGDAEHLEVCVHLLCFQFAGSHLTSLTGHSE
jgi:hypothetical protein